MNQMIKKTFYFSLCLLLFFSLAACTEKTATSDDSLYPNLEGENTFQISDSNSTKHITRISSTLSSGIVVDADVVLLDTSDLNALSVHNARMMTQDFEKAKEVLLEHKEIIVDHSEATNESLTGSPFRFCRTSDGFSLVSSGQDLYFAGDLYDRVGSILDLSEFGNSTLFLTNQDLSFATIDEAQRAVDHVLQELGIYVMSPICYTMDYDTLIAECELYNKLHEGLFDGMLDLISIDKSDECYIFLYQLISSSCPISTHMNGVFGDGSWTSGASVLCTYSANGLVSLQMDYQFEDLGPTAPPEKGLDVAQALERLEEKYNSILLDGEYLVDRIEFEYVPMPNQKDSNSYFLIPAWRFSLVRTFSDAQKDESNESLVAQQRMTSVFNAITGTELLSDSGNA